MKILVLAHNLRTAGGLSVGRNIIKTLPKVAPMHSYLMVIPAGCDYQVYASCGKVKVLECPKMKLPRRLFWEYYALRKAMFHFKPDWIWALGNIAINKVSCKQSLLLHNPHRVYNIKTRFKLSPGRYIFKRTSNWRFKKELSAIDRLYCQTETMRKRTNKKVGYPLDKIGLCPNAFTPSIIKTNSWPKKLNHIRGKFILLVLTRYYRHKNLEIIIETYARYRNELKDTVCVLAIDRTQGVLANKLINRINAENLQKAIHCVGTIPQKILGEYFNAADIMFLPTLLESFSGTYVEAMFLDTPILTSDRDFAREVCGDAAFYIDPLSPESIKDGILKLKSEPLLRKQLIKSAQKRKQLFLKSWDEIIRNVLEQEGIAHD